MIFKTYVKIISTLILLLITISCGKEDSPTESSTSLICFEVDGSFVSIRNLEGGDYSMDFNYGGHPTWINQTLTRGNITHTLTFSNIQRDTIFGNVQSFNATINGKNYSYPADRCGPIEIISFKLNSVLNEYLTSCGGYPYPYGWYVADSGNTPEQYNIFGSKTSITADCMAEKNIITISFVNLNGWVLWIGYYDENGIKITFRSLPIDISTLNIGEHLSASISDSIKSIDETITMTDLSFVVKLTE